MKIWFTIDSSEDLENAIKIAKKIVNETAEISIEGHLSFYIQVK